MLPGTRLEEEMFLDEAYFAYLGDADLSARVKREDFELVHVPASKVWYKLSMTSGFYSELYHYYLTRNRTLIMKRNGRPIYTGPPLYLAKLSSEASELWLFLEQSIGR
ncbi:MAG: hypothetical protein DRI40_04585 [Chloroflexi bacterium]|nr:MAG: hypothetical protein DRI40_04585 [Chloroflexota bacterium]